MSGRYLLQLQLAPGCTPTGSSASFPMVAAAAGTIPHPGVQVLLDGGDPGSLELEFKNTDFTLEGGFGTTGDGVTASGSAQVWVNAVGTGRLTQTSDGRGEIVAGSLRGYLEIEGMNGCTSANHSFTLRPR